MPDSHHLGATDWPTARIVYPVATQTVPRPLVKCPVCDGKTTVPPRFYPDERSTNHGRAKCRSCGGRGIV